MATKDTKNRTVGNFTFPELQISPRFSTALTFAGAGVRSIQLPNAATLDVTAIGVYVDRAIVHHLSSFVDKSGEELLTDNNFINEVLKAPVEKLATIKFIVPLTGEEYGSKAGPATQIVLESCGTFNQDEERALEDFQMIFKTLNFKPGNALNLLLTNNGDLEVSHSENDEIPQNYNGKVCSTHFGRAFFTTLLGPKTVTPATRTAFTNGIALLLSVSD